MKNNSLNLFFMFKIIVIVSKNASTTIIMYFKDFLIVRICYLLISTESSNSGSGRMGFMLSLVPMKQKLTHAAAVCSIQSSRVIRREAF